MVSLRCPRKKCRLDSEYTYRIIVQGRIDERYSCQLNDLTITEVANDGIPLTMLCGRLNDQAALHGVLNTLNNIMRLPLLLVEFVDTSDNPTG